MRTPAFALALVLTAAAVLADDTKPPEGFTPLFDGKSLDGWKMVNTRDNFFVRDGLLVLNKGNGWLATEKTFGDFELRLRYRFVTPGADSGVFIRSSLEGKNWTSRGYQVQNMDNQTLGMFVGMGIKGLNARHQKDALTRVKKPAGEWLDMTIIARGKQGEVQLNGQPIAVTDDLQVADGHIGLQAEGGVLEFARIDIKPLSAPETSGTPVERAALERTKRIAELDADLKNRKDR